MKHYSKAQIRAGFGGKRRKAALKTARQKNRPKAKAKHRPRTKPNAPKKHRQTKTASQAPKKKRKRKNGSAKVAAKKRKNVGGLWALTNPAGRKKVATKKNKSQRKRPAGSHKKANHKKKHYTHRKNAGTMGRPSDWLALGAGAVVGGLGATSLPQMVLSSSNTGLTGYFAMAAATGILAFVGHMLFKKNVMLTSGIIAGGAGALIRRVVSDYTPFGQYLNAQAGASGLGDYLSGWNFATPQIIGGQGNTALGTPGNIPVSVAGAGAGAGRALMNV